MKKLVLLLAVILLLANCSTVYSQTYESSHFAVHSDLDFRYINIILSNMEFFYEKMVLEYFPKGWDKPFDIYYSETQSESQKLLSDFGVKDNVNFGMYVSSLNAIFTHRKMNSGGLSGLGTVFHEIIHRFVDLNYGRIATWFNEGVATFLGEQTRCVNGRLTLGCANPWREQILRDMIGNGYKIDVNHLASLSSRQFYNQGKNYHPTRALFYWIYETGNLQQYLKDVKTEGYTVGVLEKTVGMSCEQINHQLQSFVLINCYPAAYYQDGLAAKTLETKKALFQKSLQIKPGYYPAQLELAQCYYSENDIEKCKTALASILHDPYCKEFLNATKLLACIEYKQKKYSNALKYFKDAWDSSFYYEYGYQIAFDIACCHHFLKDMANAKHWHRVFLDKNWNPEASKYKVDYAKKYQTLP